MPGCSKPSPPSSGPAPSAPAVGPVVCPAKPVDPWIKDILAIMCPQDKAFLQDLKARGVSITSYDRIYFEDPYYDGTKWTTKHFEAGGTTSGTDINMLSSSSAEENAATIFHEGTHTAQPSSMEWRDKEYDAYIKEDHWRISHGLGPHDPSFRNASGSTDDAKIRAFVDKEYPGVTAKPSSAGPPEQVIGRVPSGKTLVKRADGSTYTRAPKKGDSFAGPETTVPPGGRKVDMDQLQCCP